MVAPGQSGGANGSGWARSRTSAGKEGGEAQRRGIQRDLYQMSQSMSML